MTGSDADPADNDASVERFALGRRGLPLPTAQSARPRARWLSGAARRPAIVESSAAVAAIDADDAVPAQDDDGDAGDAAADAADLRAVDDLDGPMPVHAPSTLPEVAAAQPAAPRALRVGPSESVQVSAPERLVERQDTTLSRSPPPPASPIEAGHSLANRAPTEADRVDGRSQVTEPIEEAPRGEPHGRRAPMVVAPVEPRTDRGGTAARQPAEAIVERHAIATARTVESHVERITDRDRVAARAGDPEPRSRPADAVTMGLPATAPIARDDRAPVEGRAVIDLSALLAPRPVAARTLRIDRVHVTVESPRSQVSMPPAVSTIAQPAPIAAPARPPYRNPWASYHARRD